MDHSLACGTLLAKIPIAGSINSFFLLEKGMSAIFLSAMFLSIVPSLPLRCWSRGALFALPPCAGLRRGRSWFCKLSKSSFRRMVRAGHRRFPIDGSAGRPNGCPAAASCLPRLPAQVPSCLAIRVPIAANIPYYTITIHTLRTCGRRQGAAGPLDQVPRPAGAAKTGKGTSVHKGRPAKSAVDSARHVISASQTPRNRKMRYPPS